MGCRYTKVLGCYSLKCCCCVEADEACWWIGAVGVVWGAVATFVDFISAHLPEQYCDGCLDHSFNAKLSLVAGCINAVQWVASVVLLHGARKENKWLLVPWLAWSVVSLVMLVAWVVVTLPYTPSLRGTVSLIQLAWGIHYFLVVRTQYSRLALKFAFPEEMPFTVPPNTPTRRHKRRQRRLDPGCQPPIRILLGAALRIYEDFHKDVSQDEEEVRVVVGCQGGDDEERGVHEREESCSRRRGRRTTTHDTGVEARDIIIHTAELDVRRKVEQRRPHLEEDDDEGSRWCEATPGVYGGTVVMLRRAPHPSTSLPTEFPASPRPQTALPAPLRRQTELTLRPRPQSELPAPHPQTELPAPPCRQTGFPALTHPQTEPPPTPPSD